MKTVAVFDAKNRLSELLAAVEQGEEITITRHGRPVARMVSVDTPGRGQHEQVSDAMARLRVLRKGTSLGTTLAEALEDGRD